MQLKANRHPEIVTALQFSLNDATGEWKNLFSEWAHIEETGGRCIFSRFGTAGDKTIKIYLPNVWTVSPDMQFQINGQRYMIGNVINNNLDYLEITLAEVTPVLCKAERKERPVYDEYGRPDDRRATIYEFEGVLLEKYAGYQSISNAYAAEESRMILITPKQITLYPGDLIEADKRRFYVQICHISERYKNEYEIVLKDDV